MSENSLDVLNPSTGEVLKTLTTDTVADAVEKLATAHSVYADPAKRIPVHERIRLLEKTATLLDEQLEEFAMTIASEGGKPLQDARVEAKRASAGIHSAIHHLHEHDGIHYPLVDTQNQAKRRALSVSFPIGPVLAFSAFNHPLNLIVHQVIPAFAAGCPCVVKPAPDTPLSCINFVKLMRQAGIPEEYISVVITPSLDVAKALIDNLQLGFFSFIGSAKVGWMLRSQLKPGVRCALEHGGLAPAILTETADISNAVPSIVKGGFYHAGQVCVSVQRLYVHSSRLEEVTSALKSAVENLKVGDATLAETEVGPLIRTGEVNRIGEWVDEAVASGCQVLTGGKAIDAHFYAPTVLLNPAENLTVSQAEIFGPVLCVYTYDDIDDAIARANSVPFAFHAAVYSENMREIEHVYQNINASAVMVNEHSAFRDDVMPFAGLNQSGLGIGGIPYTIEDMQYQKMQISKLL